MLEYFLVLYIHWHIQLRINPSYEIIQIVYTFCCDKMVIFNLENVEAEYVWFIEILSQVA